MRDCWATGPLPTNKSIERLKARQGFFSRKAKTMQRSIIEKAIYLKRRVVNGLYSQLMRPCFSHAGRVISIMPPFRFGNLNQVWLGDNITIHPNCWIFALDEYENAGKDNKLVIGNNSCIGMNCIVAAAKKVEIGENVFFAPHVYVSDHGHGYEDPDIPIACQGIRKIREVKIGPDAWIGHGVTILPGSVVGRHCIIGANSVVNSIIPDYSIAGGTPARVLKKYDFERNAWVSAKDFGRK